MPLSLKNYSVGFESFFWESCANYSLIFPVRNVPVRPEEGQSVLLFTFNVVFEESNRGNTIL